MVPLLGINYSYLQNGYFMNFYMLLSRISKKFTDKIHLMMPSFHSNSKITLLTIVNSYYMFCTATELWPNREIKHFHNIISRVNGG